MKNFYQFLLTLLAAILPMALWADETEQQVFKSTFSGVTYGVAGETYATGTLNTDEGNDWTWNASGEDKMPVLQMTEYGYFHCLSAKVKTETLELSSDFSVPGKIQKVSICISGNIGKIELSFGGQSFAYNINMTGSSFYTYSFIYDDMDVESTLSNQHIDVLLYKKDVTSDEPMYLESISIETEVPMISDNSIVSLFKDFDEASSRLVEEDDTYNWNMELPLDGTTLENCYPTTWNNAKCLYMRLTGGSSSYSGLKLTSDFPVVGKVRKIIVTAGGDFGILLYDDNNGNIVESDQVFNNVPYYGNYTLDFGEGMKMNGNLQFYLFAGRNLFLKSITIVMDNGAVETVGITSTFCEFETWDTTENFIVGSMKSKENTPWQAFIYDPGAMVYKTSLQFDSDPSTAEECMVIHNPTTPQNTNIELQNGFDVSGKVKKVVVSFFGQFDVLESMVSEYGTGENMQVAQVVPSMGNGFTDAELIFDGITEYTRADIRINIVGREPIFLKSVTIIQKEADSNPDELRGKCGKNLEYVLTELPYTTWVWDSETYESEEVPAYKLTISGIGEMYDYDSWDNPAPWMEKYQQSITEIELPEGMTRVGNEAFYGCINAGVLSLPSTLKAIGEYAFYNLLYWRCEDLWLPEGLTYLGTRAFAYCEGFRNLYLPASLTWIGEGAINGIYNLENFYVDAANPVYKADGNAVIEKESKTLIAGNKNTVIPDYVESIGKNAFYGIRADEMPIPGKVTNIGPYAFGYSYITNVEIPSSVKTIGSYAFYSCSKLTSVTIGSGVTSIDFSPFYYSTNILDVNCYADPDALTWTSTNYEHNSFKPDKMTKMHVRAADMEKWQEKFGFLNVTFVGDLGGEVVPITDETEVMASSLQGENLNDNTVGGIYYNLNTGTGSGYENGYLVIGQTTDMSLVSDGTPGSEDVRDNFTGIILEVAPGRGVITVNARSVGKTQLAVRIGNGTPTYAAHNERWDAYVSYDVTESTYVYIYAVGNGALVKAFNNEENEPDGDALFIYGITVSPGADIDGIESLTPSSVGEKSIIYDLSGKKMQGLPAKKGIYIVNGRKIMK